MSTIIDMDSTQLATFHCEVAVKLMGRKFVEDWLASTAVPPVTETAKPKAPRGRKPGAAADGERCAWTSTAGRCKNKFHEGSTYCKMHDKKAALLNDAETAETAVSSH